MRFAGGGKGKNEEGERQEATAEVSRKQKTTGIRE